MTDLILEKMMENASEVEGEVLAPRPPPVEEEKQSLEAVLRVVGDEGPFQKFLLVLCSFVSFSVGVNFISVAFLFYQPTFFCLDGKGGRFECPEVQACANPFGKVVESAKESLTTRFEIYCENGWMEKWAKSLLYVMVAVLVLSSCSLSDRFGRRTLLIAIACMFFVSAAGVALGDSFWPTWTCFCFAYASGSCFFAVVSAYFNETMGDLTRQKLPEHVQRSQLLQFHGRLRRVPLRLHRLHQSTEHVLHRHRRCLLLHRGLLGPPGVPLLPF